MSIKNYNGDFRQVIFNIFIIGFFSIAKEWVAAHDSDSWLVGIIFSFLTMLMFCLLAINIYNCFMRGKESAESNDDRQIQALLYKQMKRLEDQMSEMMDRHSGVVSEEKIEHMFDEEKMNQLRSAKAILNKMAEIQDQQDKLMKLYEQAAAQLPVEAAENIMPGEVLMKESASEEPAEDKGQQDKPEPEEPAADILLSEELQTESMETMDSAMDQSFAELLPAGAMEDPNRELTPDEIAALFSGVN